MHSETRLPRHETRFQAEMESVVSTCSILAPNLSDFDPNLTSSGLSPKALTQHPSCATSISFIALTTTTMLRTALRTSVRDCCA